MTNLKRIRLLSEIKQCDLAKMCGVSAPLICRVENGQQEPYPALRKRISIALGALTYAPIVFLTCKTLILDLNGCPLRICTHRL